MAGSGYLFENEAPAAGDRFGQHLVAADELDRFVGRLDAGEVDPTTPLLVSAWGRRPDEIGG